MITFIAYDKSDDSGHLFALASALGLPFVRQADQALAVSALFNDRARVLFVHLDPGPWTTLSSEPSKLQERFVFRFSTQGFPPTPPSGHGRNCFHVSLPTKGDGAFTVDQFEEFAKLLQNDEALQSLQRGTIPSALRPFIWFQDPHLARALHIFMQGRFAQWALDPGHPLRIQASRLLGFDGVAMSPAGDFDWIRVLRKTLGSGVSAESTDTSRSAALLVEQSLKQIRGELSQLQDSSETPIKEVKAMLEQWLGTAPSSDHARQMDQDKALFPIMAKAFSALGESLGLVKEGVA